MNRKLALIMALTLLIGILNVALNVQNAKASGTIYIRADGSIEPPTAPISTMDNITYTLTGDIYDQIIVERSNILFDGNNNIVQGLFYGTGVNLTNVLNVTIVNFQIKYFVYGIQIENSQNIALYANSISGCEQGSILCSWSASNRIYNNSLRGGFFSVYLHYSSDNSIYSNDIYFSPKGINLDYSSNNRIYNNTLIGGGIWVENEGQYSNNIMEFNNIAASDIDGITIIRSGNNTISANNITSNARYGIQLVGSDNNTLLANILATNVYYGLKLSDSSNNKLRNNAIVNNTFNFWVEGTQLSHFINDIDTSNTINGKPIHYITNQKDLFILSTCGYVALINCTNITVEGLNLTGLNNRQGILLVYTKNSTITLNEIANNEYGIQVTYSMNNIIRANNITRNNIAIEISNSLSNFLCANNITTNSHGVFFSQSSSNIFYENNIINNINIGIQLSQSLDNIMHSNNITGNGRAIVADARANDNRIFHNNFLNNQIQVQTSGSVNIWDDDYPSGGNYWSEYSGMDLSNGNFQNVAGSDGIGDTALTIDESNKDRYPLMGSINIFDASVWNDEPKEVRVVSNSTVSSFQLDATEKTISFNVSGESVLGFCRVTVPNAILETMWEGNYTVVVDGRRVETRNWADAENTYIYFTYEHSEHKVTILQTHTTTLQIEMATGGTTDPPPDLYSHVVGDVVSVLAIPDLNYEFEYWILDGVNVGSQNTKEVLMDSNHSLQAVFTQITHQLTITSTEGGTTDPAPGTHTCVNGTVVLVTALQNVGYSFGYWRLEGEVRTVNPITILVAADGTLEAFFVDDIPPNIGSPVQHPSDDVEPYQNVTVTVNVTDLGTGVYNVTLWYSIDNGTSWTPLSMTEISTKTYQATIPGHENCNWVSYKIVAYDNSGNPAVKDNNGYYYAYHVIPEFTSALILPLLILATLVATVLHKKNRKPKSNSILFKGGT